MNFTYFCIVLAVLASSAGAIDLPAGSFSENKSLETISSSDDIKGLINETNLILNAISLTSEGHEKEELYVIGEVALSRAEKDLHKLSGDNQSSKLIEIGEFARLYGDMSFAFGMQKIPIKLSRYELPEEQISVGNNLSSENRLAGGLYQGESLFEPNPNPPTLRIVEISEGHTESSGGVGVIWDY